MANETKRIYHATVTTLEANGGSITSGSIVQANDASLDLGAYTAPADYPHVRFVFSGAFATSTGIENKVIELIARELDIDGTNDADVPTATFRQRLLESLVLKGVTTTQYIAVDVFDCPRKFDVYLYQAVGQTLSSGWTLKATPFTFGPV